MKLIIVNLSDDLLKIAEKQVLNMRNPEKPIRDIDDSPKNNEQIAKKISEILNTVENGYPENNTNIQKPRKK